MRRLYPLMAMVIVLGPVTVPAQSVGDHWTVSAVAGAVRVIGGGEERTDLNPGATVGAGTTIGTDYDGVVVLERNGDTVTIYPNSEMTIPAAQDADKSRILQTIGRMLYEMESRESRNFEVRTPLLAATIKGTTFTVVVAQSSAWVSVAEGSVHVETADGGDGKTVSAGGTATVSGDRRNSVSVVTADGKSIRGTGSRRGRSGDGDSQGDDRDGDSQGDDQDGDSQGDDQDGDSQGNDER